MVQHDARAFVAWRGDPSGIRRAGKSSWIGIRTDEPDRNNDVTVTSTGLEKWGQTPQVKRYFKEKNIHSVISVLIGTTMAVIGGLYIAQSSFLKTVDYELAQSDLRAAMEQYSAFTWIKSEAVSNKSRLENIQWRLGKARGLKSSQTFTQASIPLQLDGLRHVIERLGIGAFGSQTVFESITDCFHGCEGTNLKIEDFNRMFVYNTRSEDTEWSENKFKERFKLAEAVLDNIIAIADEELLRCRPIIDKIPVKYIPTIQRSAVLEIRSAAD